MSMLYVSLLARSSRSPSQADFLSECSIPTPAVLCLSIYVSHFTEIPLEVTYMCIYSLLGWSAFAGFLPLLLSVPLSKLLADAVTRIQKGLMSAKDKRMKLIDEMFGSVRLHM